MARLTSKASPVNENRIFSKGASWYQSVVPLTCAAVFGERERLSRIKAEQERALTRYLRREVYAYSPRYPAELEAVGLDRVRIPALDDLSRVPLTRLADIASEDQDQYVLQADDPRISGYGEPGL